MMSAMGWVLFGMAIWGLCIMMHALQRRFAPDMEGDASCMDSKEYGMGQRHAQRTIRDRDREIAELKKRIETLEAIVTDRRYQWEQDLRRSP